MSLQSGLKVLDCASFHVLYIPGQIKEYSDATIVVWGS